MKYLLIVLLLLACGKNTVTGSTVAIVENDCVKGKEVFLPHPVTKESTSFLLDGFVQYEGKTMCKASSTRDKTGNNLKTEYYYSRTPRESITVILSDTGSVLITERKTGQEAIEVN